MGKKTSSNGIPIQQAMANWAAAIEAVLQHIDRIAKGGQPNPTATSDLIAAAEAARLQCEEAHLL